MWVPLCISMHAARPATEAAACCCATACLHCSAPELQALQHNNFPHNDAGIEACYRFAAFDPFARTDYFGPRLDLGQVGRFWLSPWVG